MISPPKFIFIYLTIEVRKYTVKISLARQLVFAIQGVTEIGVTIYISLLWTKSMKYTHWTPFIHLG